MTALLKTPPWFAPPGAPARPGGSLPPEELRPHRLSPSGRENGERTPMAKKIAQPSVSNKSDNAGKATASSDTPPSSAVLIEGTDATRLRALAAEYNISPNEMMARLLDEKFGEAFLADTPMVGLKRDRGWAAVMVLNDPRFRRLRRINSALSHPVSKLAHLLSIASREARACAEAEQASDPKARAKALARSESLKAEREDVERPLADMAGKVIPFLPWFCKSLLMHAGFLAKHGTKPGKAPSLDAAQHSADEIIDDLREFGFEEEVGSIDKSKFAQIVLAFALAHGKSLPRGRKANNEKGVYQQIEDLLSKTSGAPKEGAIRQALDKVRSEFGGDKPEP